MKEKYRAFKEWKKNPRHKALYQLLCWFIFFAVLYLVAISGLLSPSYTPSAKSKDKGKVTDNSIENYINMESYEYKYDISYDDNNIIIEGIVFEDENYYTIGDNKYYDNGTLYFVDDENKQLIANPNMELPISISEIDRNVIYTWLNDSLIDETIEYNNGDKVITYTYVPSEDYEIEIIAKENEHLINSLKIDLLQLLLTKDLQFNNFDIDITYTNINNISSYEKNYDEYKIIGEDGEVILPEKEPEIEEEEKENNNTNNNKPQVRPLTKEEV